MVTHGIYAVSQDDVEGMEINESDVDWSDESEDESGEDRVDNYCHLHEIEISTKYAVDCKPHDEIIIQSRQGMSFDPDISKQ